MFNSNKVGTGLSSVETTDQLLALLADSVGYTFGDRFFLGNSKLGTASTLPDEDHPDWEWTPIGTMLYSIARCQITAGNDVILFMTGSRSGDRNKSVLCIWTGSASTRAALATTLAKADGNSTIGAKLADLLGYSDWAIVAGDSSAETNYYTMVFMNADGVQTRGYGWISPISLNLPDDGEHSYVTSYDPYSGLMLMDETKSMPTMVTWGWNPAQVTADLTMCKSTYDADYQNTTDIVHAALAKHIDDVVDTVNQLADDTNADVTGLIAANGALYAAVADISVFGNKFKDVVVAQERINDNSQYIPRP